MIVSTEQLGGLGSVTMVDGGFDPLHDGHVAYFRAAAQLGLPVLCNVSPDAYVARKHHPLLTAEQRGAVIDALEPITYVHLSSGSTAEALRALRPARYAKGEEWRDRLPDEELRLCAELGVRVDFLDTKIRSSTGLLESLVGTGADEQAVDRFERAIADQRPVEPGHYDDAYFVGDWREGGNRYDVETRRRIEGRNPALIHEVFAPRRVLDVGCGPGALMLLLDELGIDVDGIDYAESSRELAPERVRDRIRVAPVTDRLVEDRSYDLVVCREVLEHLTVLEVRRAVTAMCAASSRYVYVTTRFHPQPAHLLDFTTQFDVDPSHITLLNKAFLRCLFLLEGFRRRPELETRMDWGGKHRVLVYKRPA